MIPVVRGIAAGGVTVLMIEHVMQAVMNLAEHVWVLAQGQLIAAGLAGRGHRATRGDRGLPRARRRRAGPMRRGCQPFRRYQRRRKARMTRAAARIRANAGPARRATAASRCCAASTCT
jgi:energy-coupling factor transporter ATP-binding protein EcfA2